MTKFYLRVALAANPPSNGEKSTALPVGTATASNSGTGFEDLSLSTTIGTAATNKQLNSTAQTAHQDNYIARFTSAALAAQTINADTWTFGYLPSETNNNALSATVISLYVWRPGTSSVVGFIFDSDTPISDTWQEGDEADLVTFSGASVVAQAADVLVLEFWRHASQGKAVSYAQILYFDGTTEITANAQAFVGNTDAASAISTPQTLTFDGAAAALRRYSLPVLGVG